MNQKILLFTLAFSLGVYSSFACGKSMCGGGPTFCCKDGFGATYYLTKPAN
jgi:hypothetical protein